MKRHPYKVTLAEKFDLIHDFWSPGIVGELNGQHVKLAKFRGEFCWHQHDDEDELFLVIRGRIVIKLRDGEMVLNEGEFGIIPKGVEHMPVAEEEAHILLFEPASTINTGESENELTTNPDWV
ncbi:Cupin domain protein [compost metagenome]